MSANADLFNESGSRPRFVGRAYNAQMSANLIPDFQLFLNQHGQAFLENMDTWLTSNQHQDTTEQADLVRLGVGVFTIQDNTDTDKE
jgi:hypothetical protein